MSEDYTTSIVILLNILGLLKPIMNIVEEREEYTFFQATSDAMTPDVMLSDIYEVD